MSEAAGGGGSSEEGGVTTIGFRGGRGREREEEVVVWRLVGTPSVRGGLLFAVEVLLLSALGTDEGDCCC
jgi:hypothetical protein